MLSSRPQSSPAPVYTAPVRELRLEVVTRPGVKVTIGSGLKGGLCVCVLPGSVLFSVRAYHRTLLVHTCSALVAPLGLCLRLRMASFPAETIYRVRLMKAGSEMVKHVAAPLLAVLSLQGLKGPFSRVRMHLKMHVSV